MNTSQRLEIRLEGLVQGVGMRPWIYRLATGHQLRGWVGNSCQGVEVVLEGPRLALERCLRDLQRHPPRQARIDGLTTQWAEAQGLPDRFAIAPPLARAPASAEGATTALVTPDLATCPACFGELGDPSNRRHGYPLISCTDCGPRYSVVRQLPFERDHTSLAAFPLCASCTEEYGDPTSRRFHAQTMGCPACGPKLTWHSTQGESAAAITSSTITSEAIACAAAALKRGEIVALQGMGGFQLLVDACQVEAVAELRRRKVRPDKPLALMARGDWIRQHCHLKGAEAALLDGPVAPILLLRRRSKPLAKAEAPELGPELAPNVAGPSPWLGVMRPTTGLHHLLLEAFGGVVVATSANRSGEPIITEHRNLGNLADGVLRHGLAIVNRIDDAVMRLSAHRPLVLRLGRGLAPVTLRVNQTLTSAIGGQQGGVALGAQSKGSLAITLNQPAGGQLIQLSPDLGNLGCSAGERHLRRTLGQWLRRHGLQPEAVACDRHDGYVSTQLAMDWVRRQAAGPTTPKQIRLKSVQHHHAHLLACMAEHGLQEAAVGLAFDGAGLGDDGTLWGGECLRVHPSGYQRLAHLRPFPLPGGEVALREPRRAALGLLVEAFGNGWRSRLPAPAWEAPDPEGTGKPFSTLDTTLVEQALQQRLNCPSCSSVGRLFDAVAALLGLRQTCGYEGQAAMELEALAMESLAVGPLGLEKRAFAELAQPYRITLQRGAARQRAGHRDRQLDGHREWRFDAQPKWQLDWQPMLEQILADLEAGVPKAPIALGFHRALAAVVAELAEALQLEQVLLAGGCFQNHLLLEASISALQQRGIRALWPQTLPCNDAAIAVGQLMAL